MIASPAAIPTTRTASRIPAIIACAHCGLPVPPGLVNAESSEQFCCHGCRTAYGIIHGCGLEGYYRVRGLAHAMAAAARGTGGRYSEMDDSTFTSMYVTEVDGSLRRVEFFLEGVHCAACVWLVERLPRVVPGVVETRLDPRRALVSVLWDPACTTASAVARGLDSLGYAVHPVREGAARALRRQEERRTLVRIAVAAACAGNVMLLALALYSGLFDSMDRQYAQLFRWVSMGIMLISVAWPGSVFFRGAVAAIRARAINLDLPIAIGLAAGTVWGVFNTLRGSGEIYFDSLSVLVFALLVGRAIQARQQRWSADALELLFSLTPASARRVDGSSVAEVPVEAIRSGDLIEVLAGESFAADGQIESGRSSVDQSLLTGESAPVAVEAGDLVSAGAVNLAGVLRVRVAATGEATRVGRLMKIVEEGTRRRAPIVRLADRIASIFVVVVLLVAAATALVWAFIDPSRAIDNAAALLIVTCPCALGLATPLAVTVVIGRAAKRGILVKGGDAVQVLAGRGVMFLDKTGTLTMGRMSVVRWFGPQRVKHPVAVLESVSTHPIARALAAQAGAAGETVATDVRQERGAGISGFVGSDHFVAGSGAYVRRTVAAEDTGIADAELACLAEGLTPVLIGENGRIVAVAGVGDQLRDDARRTLVSLQRRGWSVRVLSGDHPAVVAAVAERLGIPKSCVRGGATPEDKLHVITTAAETGPVVMVGDGVNDAAALAAAAVGIAVHGGAEASLSAADVYLSRPGLSAIDDLVRASKRTFTVIRVNLTVSLLYNGLAGALAVTGLITPLMAALLMPISSLTVLALSLKSRTFGGGTCR